MKVYNELQTIITSPSDSLLEERQLALNIRLPGADLERPISDRQADMV